MDVGCVLHGITVINDHIINNAVVASESRKGLVHPAIVVATLIWMRCHMVLVKT